MSKLFGVRGRCEEDVFLKLESSILIDSSFVTHDWLVLKLRSLDFTRRLMVAIALLGCVEFWEFDTIAVQSPRQLCASISFVGRVMSWMSCA